MSTTTARPVVILLAEDDPADVTLTRRALLEAKIANELHVVEDGEELLNYLHRRGPYQDPVTSPWPDLILLDLNMPKVSGYQALKAIRSDPDLRRIAVVILSTSELDEDVVRSYDLGCNSYITKPVSMHDFVRTVLSLEQYWFHIVMLSPEDGGPAP
jgi:CheY-like chemotaxis protein